MDSLADLGAALSERIAELQRLSSLRLDDQTKEYYHQDLLGLEANVQALEEQVAALKAFVQSELSVMPKVEALIEASRIQSERTNIVAKNLPARLPRQVACSVQGVSLAPSRPGAVGAGQLDALQTGSKLAAGGTAAGTGVTVNGGEDAGRRRKEAPRWYVTEREFEAASSYLRGRLQTDKVNAALDELAGHALNNSKLIAAVKGGGTKLAPADRKRATELLHSVAMKDGIKGHYWFLESDLREGTAIKLDKTGKSMLTLLRHLGRLQEAAICHSLSVPLEDPSSKDATQPRGTGGRTERSRPPNMSRLVMRTRECESNVMPSAAMNTASCATYDNARRCLSLDIPAAALSSPASLNSCRKPRALVPSLMASADVSGEIRSSELQSLSPRYSMDMTTLETPSAGGAPPGTLPSHSTLLALCPGVPGAMRRQRWCIEDYQIGRKLYKGATSSVYKATCRHSSLPVALKVYFLSKVPRNVIHMIVREIKIHVELVHKHIVMLYGAFQKRLVLVQEYAGRGDLYGIYRSLNRRMTEAHLVFLVLAPFMDALSYLHAKGICHRDIKPENILFTNDWRLLLADFGVSIDLNQERAVTRAGTLEYMAPEVERCPLKMLPEENKEKMDLAYTTAVDIWATGVLAYELLVGFAPFVGERPQAPTTTTHAAVGPISPKFAGGKNMSFPSSTSPHARDFISLALAEAPEDRPTSLQLSRHPWLGSLMQQDSLNPLESVHSRKSTEAVRVIEGNGDRRRAGPAAADRI
ncbi:hypothetical protein VOLCADRAFT_121093 [Volvox carteri f. nagariensis]|uniref:Protein kinase domain-containing protein n=1 Tax=Volvox carteri f. nagariensis TaxID=3068 RepID=D8U2B3_VOLCA|nr:uncharacterized protein VOLCADRAFT_121093 [Volvox carteri f. nagariensis]EFJ46034.1 hypothetical protein VOLCADRAFT_121093 [Volvox carteri f. nagariensis]|eukprot:XP_002952784.1 hypothetical protein VOLCADRAFT_121093 [Volvox carteri f. nagariensis]